MGDKAGAKTKKRRIIVPEAVKISLYTESGYRCAVPTCRGIIVLDMHHIVHVEDGGGNDQSNLLPLCPTCHALYHRGDIVPESIKAWKLMLMSLANAFDKKSVDILLMLSTYVGIYVSGDGVLECAALIASRFVNVRSVSGELHPQSDKLLPASHYNLSLTKKGELFVEGWKNGDLSVLDHIGSDAG